MREEELATVVAACGLEDMTDHFIPRRRYRGSGCWTWRMQREGRKVKGRGEYVLGTIRCTFFDAGVIEARVHTEHRMVLAELHGQGSQINGAYRMRRQG